jgi:hypothetical protein
LQTALLAVEVSHLVINICLKALGFGMPLIPSGLLLVFLRGFSVGGFARLDRKR